MIPHAHRSYPIALHQFLPDGHTITAAPHYRAADGSIRWMRAIDGVPVRDAAGRPYLCDTAEQALAYACYDLDRDLGDYDRAVRQLKRAEATVRVMRAGFVQSAVRDGVWCGPGDPPPFDRRQFCTDAVMLVMDTGPLRPLRVALDGLMDAMFDDALEDAGAVPAAHNVIVGAVQGLLESGCPPDVLEAACGLWSGATGCPDVNIRASGAAPAEALTDEVSMLTAMLAWAERRTMERG